jgi:hypothetical protein
MRHTFYKAFIFILSVGVFHGLLISCKKKKSTPELEKQWLLTLNLTNDFVNPKLGAIVFISDAKGNQVTDTLVSGNTRLVINTDQHVAVPFQVTIVKWEPDMHNFLVTINTYMNVTPAEWTIRGQRLVSSGDAVVNLLNVPVHSGPILYSGPGYSNLTFATTGNTIPLFNTPDDLYVKLNASSVPLFKWTSGIVPAGNYDIDLSSMGIALQHNISLPVPAQDFLVKVMGYRDTSNINSLPYLTDEQIGSGTKVDSINVSYPPSVFKSYHTYIQMIESWTSSSTYAYAKDGQVPDSFVRINASISADKIEGSRTSFTSSGQFTVTSAKWTFQDANKLAFEWTVSGPDTLTTISLPVIPPSMKSMFPTLSPDSLQLYQFELIHYPAIKSYPEYLAKSFNPADPGRKDKLESSSVRTQIK